MRNKPCIDKQQLDTIGERIRKIRAAQNPPLSQEGLAEALDVTRETVGQWERGFTPPSLSSLLKICDLYHVDLDYICGRLDCQTHDLQYIHDLTGLSETAISNLQSWHKNDDASIYCYPNMISYILEDGETVTLLQHLNTYDGCTLLSQWDFDEDGHAPGTNNNIKAHATAALWNVSRIFSNIVERLFG